MIISRRNVLPKQGKGSQQGRILCRKLNIRRSCHSYNHCSLTSARRDHNLGKSRQIRQLFFRNNRTFNDPKHLRLRWLLPDGFTVSGGRRDLYLPHLSMHSDATASVTFTITAGDHVDSVNRPVLEVIAQGRPTAGYLPVILMG